MERELSHEHNDIYYAGFTFHRDGMFTLAIAFITGVLIFSINDGIERIMAWIVPMLVLVLVAVAVMGLILEGGLQEPSSLSNSIGTLSYCRSEARSVRFSLNRLSSVDSVTENVHILLTDSITRSQTWIAAPGHTLFSTGLGWEIALTFESYTVGQKY